MSDEDAFKPRADVATSLGVSTTTVKRWCDVGDVRAELRGRAWWVHWDDAQKRAADEDEKVTDGIAAAMAHMIGALKGTQQHVNSLQEPAKVLLSTLAEENQRLRARCAELENKHLEMLAVYEKAQQDEHARKLAELDAIARQRRLDEAFQTLQSYGPLVATMVGAHFLGDSAAPLQEGALREMLAEMDDEKAAALASTLAPEKAATLLEIRKQVRDGKQKAKQGNGKTKAA